MQSVVIEQLPIKDGEAVNLKLEGDLTLTNAYAIKQNFIDASEKYNELNILISNVDGMDISFIQLLLSLKRSVNNLNKTIAIKMDLSQDLKLLVERSGFAEILTPKSNPK